MMTWTVAWQRRGPRDYALLVNDVEVDTAMSESDAARWVSEWTPPEGDTLPKDLGRKTGLCCEACDAIVARFLRESTGV